MSGISAPAYAIFGPAIAWRAVVAEGEVGNGGRGRIPRGRAALTAH
jgi:hypothetical protein